MSSKRETEAQLTERVRKKLRKLTSTDAGMRRFLNETVGVGNYSYDANEDVWVMRDGKHTGPGRGFIIIRRGGSWFSTVVPDGEIS